MKQMLRDMKWNTFISISRGLIMIALLVCAVFFAAREEIMQYIGLIPAQAPPDTGIIVIFYAQILLLLYALLALGWVLSGLAQRQARKFISQLDMVEKERLVYDYQNAWKASHVIKAGRLYTFTNDQSTRIYQNKNIVWVYANYEERRGHKTYYLQFYLLGEPAPTRARIGKKIYPDVLEYYAKNFPHIVVGYSKDLNRCYRNDRNQFLHLQYYNEENRPEELFLNEK